MKIFDRFCLLVRADAHGIMDQLEERALLIKQNLREAELALEQKRARAEAIDEALGRLECEAERSRRAIEGFDRDIALALAQDEEALARFAIRQLIPERARLLDTRTRIEDLRASRERLDEALREQAAALDALRIRARARLADLERETDTPEPIPPSVADEDVELELLRRRTAAPDAAAGEGEALR